MNSLGYNNYYIIYRADIKRFCECIYMACYGFMVLLTRLLIFSERNGRMSASSMLMYQGWFTMYTPLKRAGKAFCQWSANIALLKQTMELFGIIVQCGKEVLARCVGPPIS